MLRLKEIIKKYIAVNNIYLENGIWYIYNPEKKTYKKISPEWIDLVNEIKKDLENKKINYIDDYLNHVKF